MAIQLGTNLLTGADSGGSGTPINTYGAFNINPDITQFVDVEGSVWLQTGQQLFTTDTGHFNDGQVYVDQGANTNPPSPNASFAGSGTAVLNNFNANFLGTSGVENRAPVFQWDGINDQFIVFNSVNNLTNLRYVTMSPQGVFGTTVEDVGSSLLGGAVGDGSGDFYAIYTTACTEPEARQIFRVSGAYPYTSTPHLTITGGVFAAATGSRSLLVDDNYFYIFENYNSPDINAIRRINKTTGATDTINLDASLLGFWQHSGQTEVCWGAVQNADTTDNASTTPNYFREYRFTPTGPQPTGSELEVSASEIWQSPESTYFGIDPSREGLYHHILADGTFNLEVRQLKGPSVGDTEATFTYLRGNTHQFALDGGNTNEFLITRTLPNYIKIGNIEIT